MASGVAIIGSDSGAIPDVIGSAGLIFPEDNLAALRKALQQLITDPSLREKLVEQGRQRVIEHFTQKEIAQKTVAVYHEMIDNKNGDSQAAL
jgi:glycosyltransferase involved in cell wall biosynthesis